MRQKSYLHNLRTISLRFVPKRQSGMVLFLLTAPTAEKLEDAREHLRYWPYVKAFRPLDKTHMKVLIFVGRGIPKSQWNYYVTRSSELMNHCVRQYQALFVTTNRSPSLWLRHYHCNGFLRPDDLLKPFCDFIDELNHQESNSFNNNSVKY